MPSKYHHFKKNIKNYLVKTYNWTMDEAKQWALDNPAYLRNMYDEGHRAAYIAKLVNISVKGGIDGDKMGRT